MPNKLKHFQRTTHLDAVKVQQVTATSKPVKDTIMCIYMLTFPTNYSAARLHSAILSYRYIRKNPKGNRFIAASTARTTSLFPVTAFLTIVLL